MFKYLKMVWDEVKKFFSYEGCYQTKLEKGEITKIDECSGEVGGTKNTDYLSERCIGCPYLKKSDK